MKASLRVAVYALIAVNLLMLALLVGRSLPGGGRVGGRELECGVKWTVYVGLNDRDVGRPVMSVDEAKVRLNVVASGHVDGFTVGRAEGYWTNGEGGREHEDTLVYYFLDATEAQIVAMVEDMKKALNQESVLLERSGISRIFY